MVKIQMKKCNTCNKKKSKDDFYPALRTIDRLRGSCKPCEVKKSSVRQKLRRKRNPTTFHNTRLKQKYGITFEQYRAMLAAQSNACKICGSFNPGASKDHFSVDHDHKTGEIRGILCHGCNAGLGMFREDVRSLKEAIRYLESVKPCV